MNDETETSGERKSFWTLVLALGLALLPSVMILSLFTFFSNRRTSSTELVMACLFCVVCCFSSSFLLFARRTVWAIVLGALFLLLNAVISLFFGCLSMFPGGV
jgi:hypothetical protein